MKCLGDGANVWPIGCGIEKVWKQDDGMIIPESLRSAAPYPKNKPCTARRHCHAGFIFDETVSLVIFSYATFRIRIFNMVNSRTSGSRTFGMVVSVARTL